MIPASAFVEVKIIPIRKLHVREYQVRYPDRLTHYLNLLALPGNADSYPGLIIVRRRKTGYEILDGHHRYCALVLSGRRDALCAVVTE